MKQEGVEWLACFPSNPLISAVARIGIRPVAFRHERGAVMAADGYSRISDRQRFGVVAACRRRPVPRTPWAASPRPTPTTSMLVFLGGNASALSVRPNFTAARNYEGWVKRVEAIYTPDQVGDVMRRAFHALRNGTPGPVVVELTADVCAREVPKRHGPTSHRSWFASSRRARRSRPPPTPHRCRSRARSGPAPASSSRAPPRPSGARRAHRHPSSAPCPASPPSTSARWRLAPAAAPPPAPPTSG
ncbi:MAG: thiamine pyrophosphate-binding protein [Geminicoccaceae bacterium]